MISWGGPGFLQVAGKQLEFDCFGAPPGAAPTLVLLHEGLGCVALWRDFPQILADQTGWGVFVYSRQGYGRSDPCDLPRPLDYMSREAVSDLPAVLNQIGFQHGAVLGHSDGATIAAVYAGLVRDPRLCGLILIAPHFFTEPLGLAAIRQAKQAYDNATLRTRLMPYHCDVECAFRGWNDAWLDPDFKDWSVRNVLDHITCPVLAIQDRADPYGTLAQIDAITERCRGPVKQMILTGAGHAPHLSQPDAILAEITEFLGQLSFEEV